MEMLRQVSRALTAVTVGPNSLLQGVARAVIGVSGAASCLITVTKAGTAADQLIEVGEGVDSSAQGKPLTHVAPGLVTQVVIEQRPVFSEDIQLDGRFPLDALAQRYGWRAAIGLPLFLERAFAGTIHTSGRRLLKLINDILELTHIQAGRLELHPAPCLLAEAVDAALSENAAAATQKDLTVTSRIERSLQVVFDPRSLRHVVHNLVNNAVKFTPERGTIVISAVESEPGTVVEVRDTGIGIKPEDQPRLFEEFRQIDGSTSRGYEGVGLGLALSKRLVGLQGGQICVESLPGKGRKFRFLIPTRPELA